MIICRELKLIFIKTKKVGGASVEEVYRAFPEAITIIEQACAEEIAQFGYTAPKI